MRIENEHLVIRELPSHLHSVEQVDSLLDLVQQKFGISKKRMFDIRLALTEAVNNAMIHGNYLDQQKTVIISCIKFAHCIKFTIKDEGRGFNMVECLQEPEARKDNPNGRGLFLIHRLADKVIFSDKGRVVEMEFSI